MDISHHFLSKIGRGPLNYGQVLLLLLLLLQATVAADAGIEAVVTRIM
jgi:hypothetical protein